MLWVSVPDVGDQDLLDSLICFCHQISGRTFQLHFFLLLKCRQNNLKTHTGINRLSGACLCVCVCVRMPGVRCVSGVCVCVCGCVRYETFIVLRLFLIQTLQHCDLNLNSPPPAADWTDTTQAVLLLANTSDITIHISNIWTATSSSWCPLIGVHVSDNLFRH